MSPKRARFCREYLKDLNAAQAAIRAGYSEKGARTTGCRLLADANIQAKIQKSMEKRNAETEVTAARVVTELARVAFAQIGHVVSWGPEGVALTPSADLSDGVMSAVSEVSQTQTAHGPNVKVRMHDKLKALDSLAKHTGVYDSDEAKELRAMLDAMLKQQPK